MEGSETSKETKDVKENLIKAKVKELVNIKTSLIPRELIGQVRVRKLIMMKMEDESQKNQ